MAMRTLAETKKIVYLRDSGFSHSEISRELDIPRTTIRDICQKYADVSQLAEEAVSNAVQWRFESSHRQYAYLLGMYLGDGCISECRRCYKLRITLDKKYPGIIAETVAAIQSMVPNNKVGIVDRETWVEVYSYSKHWLDAFPQHGDGKKHQRKIILKPWQRKIVKKFPQQFLRGLIHSDGCRDRNLVDGIEYPRYTFTNYSQDIMGIFKKNCRQLGVSYTASKDKKRCMIATRKNVAYLDKFIGEKK